MGEQKTLCQLKCGGANYYLLTKLRDEGNGGFDLILSNGYSGWTGKVSRAMLSTLSKGVKMKLEDYVSETNKALTRKDLGNLHFQYQVKLGTDTATLVWKKHVPTDNIKFQLGQAVLDESPEPADVINSIFEQAIDATSSLQATISTLEADNQRLAAERASALKRLEKYVSAKEELEKDLYAKFAIVVNDKKAKIRDLKEECEEVKEAGPTCSSSNSKLQASTSRGRHVSSDSVEEAEDERRMHHSNSEYDTDEEKNEAPPVKKAKGSKASIQRSPEAGDSSLLLDMGEDEEDEVPPTARRQRRGQRGRKMATPSRPVLPRASSGKERGSRDSTASTPGRTPLGRKASRGSNASNRSSEDVEQLLDEL